MPTRTIHGVSIVVPDGWDDWSQYRFAVPRDDDAPKLAIGQSERLRANLVISRRSLAKGQSVEAAMQELNDQVAASAPSFEVLAGGHGTYQAQRMLWQDSSLVHGSSNLPVFQRHVLIPNEIGSEVVLLVLSGEKADIDRMSSAMGFD